MTLAGTPIEQLTSTEDRVLITADFPNRTPQALFDLFTKAELLVQWWPQQAEVDLRVGGGYHLAWPEMDWHLRGTYTVVEAPDLLGFSWHWDHTPELPVRDVTLFITPEGSGSRLLVMHGFYDNTEPDQADRQGHLDGWLHFLAVLKAL